MTVFADSSALVKRYVDEPGAVQMRSLDALVVSSLARVEVPSALWRKARAEGLSPVDAALLVAEFSADWCGEQLAVVSCSGEVLEQAVNLVARHALRGYDAVQLASAGSAREVSSDIQVFACFDRNLREAAARENWVLLP